MDLCLSLRSPRRRSTPQVAELERSVAASQQAFAAARTSAREAGLVLRGCEQASEEAKVNAALAAKRADKAEQEIAASVRGIGLVDKGCAIRARFEAMQTAIQVAAEAVRKGEPEVQAADDTRGVSERAAQHEQASRATSATAARACTDAEARAAAYETLLQQFQLGKQIDALQLDIDAWAKCRNGAFAAPPGDEHGTRRARPQQASGFKLPVEVRPKLTEFLNDIRGELGDGELSLGECVPRTSVTRFVTNYIKNSGLQDENERKIIVLDEKLATLVGSGVGDRVTWFQLQSLLAPLYDRSDEGKAENLRQKKLAIFQAAAAQQATEAAAPPPPAAAEPAPKKARKTTPPPPPSDDDSTSTSAVVQPRPKAKKAYK